MSTSLFMKFDLKARPASKQDHGLGEVTSRNSIDPDEQEEVSFWRFDGSPFKQAIISAESKNETTHKSQTENW